MRFLTSLVVAATCIGSYTSGFLQISTTPRPPRESVVALSASYLETLSRTSSSASSDSWSNSAGRPAPYTSPRSAPAPAAAPASSRSYYESAVKVEMPPTTSDPKFTGPATPVQYVELAPAPAPLASTMAPAVVPRTVIEPPPVGVTYEAYGDVDAKALLSRSTFPIKADALVALAKDAVFTRGLGMNDNGKCLADDFVFRGAHVETKRSEYLGALKSFNLGESFRVKQQFFGWIVDPIQPNRVWFMNRQEAEQIKEFYGTGSVGKRLILPPECLHVDFNEYGQVKEFGFYTVDRAQGNTGGLGGAFGYFYGVGKPLPFPEANPYKMSKRRRFFEFVGRVMSKIQAKWAATRS